MATFEILDKSLALQLFDHAFLDNKLLQLYEKCSAKISSTIQGSQN